MGVDTVVGTGAATMAKPTTASITTNSITCITITTTITITAGAPADGVEVGAASAGDSVVMGSAAMASPPAAGEITPTTSRSRYRWTIATPTAIPRAARQRPIRSPATIAATT